MNVHVILQLYCGCFHGNFSYECQQKQCTYICDVTLYIYELCICKFAYNFVHLKNCEQMLWNPLICRAKVLNCSGVNTFLQLDPSKLRKGYRSNSQNGINFVLIPYVIVTTVISYSGGLVSMAINAKACYMYMYIITRQMLQQHHGLSLRMYCVCRLYNTNCI